VRSPELTDPGPSIAEPRRRIVGELRSWPTRRRVVAAAVAVVTVLVVGVPTDVIPNPLFDRPVEVTWWSWPVLVATGVLAGLLAATYVRHGARGENGAENGGENGAENGAEADRSVRLGGVGGLLAYFAVGCPVCNKFVLLALGATGAMEFFAPIQPVLAVAGVVVLAIALRVRLRTATACPVPLR
jgi:hypothetical protein